ncbi:hypothetical protein D3C87_940160 [compost metagenome]
MSLPIDIFRIMNGYMPFNDKYKVCSVSEELQCIILEDLSINADDIVNVFNEGDMNQIQFALKHCKQDIELKLHECIQKIANVESIIFIIQEFLTKICRFLETPMQIDDNSNYSKMYDDYTFDDEYDDNNEELSCITDFDDLEIFDNPKTEYERRSNLLMSINEKIDKDLKYYCLIKYIPDIILDIDYRKMFPEVIKNPDNKDLIRLMFNYRTEYYNYVILTDEVFTNLINLHEDEFNELFSCIAGYKIFAFTTLPMLIKCYENCPYEKFDKIFKSVNIQSMMDSLSTHIKNVPIDLLILIIDCYRDIQQNITLTSIFRYTFDPIPTLHEIVRSNDLKKLEVFMNYMKCRYGIDYRSCLGKHGLSKDI